MNINRNKTCPCFVSLQWDLMTFFTVWFGFSKSPFPPQTYRASSSTGFLGGWKNDFSCFAFYLSPINVSNSHPWKSGPWQRPLQHSQSCCRSSEALALGVLRPEAEPHLLSCPLHRPVQKSCKWSHFVLNPRTLLSFPYKSWLFTGQLFL